MDDWTMKNFDINYCYQFMMMLQGRIPVRVRLFLIVNPPPWFGKVWAMMKPMLSKEFQKKVKMIPECQLDQYLRPGFEQYLPDEMVTGQAGTSEIVRDWMTYRNYLESNTEEPCTNDEGSDEGSDDSSVPDF